jgi:phosphate transport system protein
MSPRPAFEKQLNDLTNEMHGIAHIARMCMTHACDIVTRGTIDSTWPFRTYESDLSQHERNIETQCLRILLCQQPVASDLRDVSGALKSVTDFRRIGELSLEVCRVADLMGESFCDARDEKLATMSQATKHMVITAIESYLEHDVEKARTAASEDDELDAFLVDLREETIARIFNREIDAENGVDLLMIAKYLERIGDHAESLSSWTEYLVSDKTMK